MVSQVVWASLVGGVWVENDGQVGGAYYFHMLLTLFTYLFIIIINLSLYTYIYVLELVN